MGVMVKGLYVLLNKEGDKTLSHSPVTLFLWCYVWHCTAYTIYQGTSLYRLDTDLNYIFPLMHIIVIKCGDECNTIQQTQSHIKLLCEYLYSLIHCIVLACLNVCLAVIAEMSYVVLSVETDRSLLFSPIIVNGLYFFDCR